MENRRNNGFVMEQNIAKPIFIVRNSKRDTRCGTVYSAVHLCFPFDFGGFIGIFIGSIVGYLCEVALTIALHFGLVLIFTKLFYKAVHIQHIPFIYK